MFSFYKLVDSIGTESCKKVAIPFICQYAFFLCHDGNIYLPSQETCIDISTNVCRDEWSLAISLHVPLPNCNELPLAGISLFIVIFIANYNR